MFYIIVIAIEHGISYDFFLFFFFFNISRHDYFSDTEAEAVAKEWWWKFLNLPFVSLGERPMLPHLAVNSSSSTWEIMLVIFEFDG